MIGVVLIFLAGYLPGSSHARRASEASRQSSQRLEEVQAELAKTRFDLEVARLRGSLGEVLHEANANNFGVAAERATAFLDGLRVAGQRQPASDRRSVLEAILAWRDGISADLARADQGVKAKLAETFMQFARAVSIAIQRPATSDAYLNASLLTARTEELRRPAELRGIRR